MSSAFQSIQQLASINLWPTSVSPLCTCRAYCCSGLRCSPWSVSTSLLFPYFNVCLSSFCSLLIIWFSFSMPNVLLHLFDNCKSIYSSFQLFNKNAFWRKGKQTVHHQRKMHKMCQASSTPTLHFIVQCFLILNICLLSIVQCLYALCLYALYAYIVCLYALYTSYAWTLCTLYAVYIVYICVLYVYICCVRLYALYNSSMYNACTMLVQSLYNALWFSIYVFYPIIVQCFVILNMSFIPSDSTTQTVIVYVPPEVQMVISWCLPMLPQETCPTTTISPVAAKRTSLECWTQWDQEQTVLWVRCDFITGKCFL